MPKAKYQVYSLLIVVFIVVVTILMVVLFVLSSDKNNSQNVEVKKMGRNEMMQLTKIKEKQVTKLANQTEQAKEFLKLYPNAFVDVNYGTGGPCVKCNPRWFVRYLPETPKKIKSYRPIFENQANYEHSEDIEMHAAFLVIELDSSFNINSPVSIEKITDVNFTKNEKYCTSQHDCYPINYSTYIDCVNRIYMWKVQKELDTQPLFYCGNSIENHTCYIDYFYKERCDCVNNACTVVSE